jgi:hypothetical protein
MGSVKTMDHARLTQEADYHDVLFSIRHGKINDPHCLFQQRFKGRQFWLATEGKELVGLVVFKHSDYTKRLYILESVSVVDKHKDRYSIASRLLGCAFESLRSGRHLATIAIDITPDISYLQSVFYDWQKQSPDHIHITPRG